MTPARLGAMTLSEFLEARIHDDECLARMAFADHNDNGPHWSEPWSGAVDLSGDPSSELLLCNDSGVSRHIVNFDPARVLAECEAKRGIVSRHTSCDDSSYGEPCEDLRDIALPYADHPDYLQKWKP